MIGQASGQRLLREIDRGLVAEGQAGELLGPGDAGRAVAPRWPVRPGPDAAPVRSSSRLMASGHHEQEPSVMRHWPSHAQIARIASAWPVTMTPRLIAIDSTASGPAMPWATPKPE